jgi:myo-inositol-1(or 4)-monophosphatase
MLMRDFYGKTQKITWQNLNDLKTAADKASGKVIRPMLIDAFPKIGILSEEEEAYRSGAERLWVVDELDGTIVFTHAVKSGAKVHRISDHWSVMIALCEGRVPVLGVIYAPARGELFVAERGKGAFVSMGHRYGMAVSMFMGMIMDDTWRIRSKNRETDVHRITIGVDPGKVDKAVPGRRLRLAGMFEKLFADDGVNCVWTGGCASIPIALTATGIMDAYVSMGLSPEDMAAGAVLNREVGNKVTTTSGKEWELGDESILIANPVLHGKLLTMLRS